MPKSGSLPAVDPEIKDLRHVPFAMVQTVVVFEFLKHIGPSAFALYAYLICRAKDGQCFPSYDRVTFDTGLASETIRRAIGTLEGVGLVAVRRRRNGKRNANNLYTLTEPDEAVLSKWLNKGLPQTSISDMSENDMSEIEGELDPSLNQRREEPSVQSATPPAAPKIWLRENELLRGYVDLQPPSTVEVSEAQRQSGGTPESSKQEEVREPSPPPAEPATAVGVERQMADLGAACVIVGAAGAAYLPRKDRMKVTTDPTGYKPEPHLFPMADAPDTAPYFDALAVKAASEHREAPGAAPAPAKARKGAKPSDPRFEPLRAALIELHTLNPDVYGWGRLGKDVNRLLAAGYDETRYRAFKVWYEKILFPKMAGGLMTPNPLFTYAGKFEAYEAVLTKLAPAPKPDPERDAETTRRMLEHDAEQRAIGAKNIEKSKARRREQLLRRNG